MLNITCPLYLIVFQFLQCPLCQTVVGDNLELMKHLLGHSEKQPTAEELLNISQCRYCAKNFPTEGELDQHVLEVSIFLFMYNVIGLDLILFVSTMNLTKKFNNASRKKSFKLTCF